MNIGAASSRRTRTVLFAMVTVIGLIIAALVLLLLPQNDGGIRQEAEGFKPTAMHQVIEHYTPKSVFCFDKDGCPALMREYVGKHALSAAELVNLAERAGWYTRIDHTCQPRAGITNGKPLCALEGNAGNFHVRITQHLAKDKLAHLKLSLEPSA